MLTIMTIDDTHLDTRAARRENRRRSAGARRMIDTSVPSPCVQICQIDKATASCTGCKRTLDEIRDWMILTAEEKLSVLDALASR